MTEEEERDALADKMQMQPAMVSEHRNSEGEMATIQRVRSGPFAGRLLLVIHDDPPSTIRAPMLLDEGTRAWLRTMIAVAEEAEDWIDPAANCGTPFTEGTPPSGEEEHR